MLFMVVETIKDQDAAAVYQRLRDNGRMMPEGLTYINSWIEANFDRVYQLMDCDDPRLFQEWIAHWNDLMEFEIVPVVPSPETIQVMEPYLDDGKEPISQ